VPLFIVSLPFSRIAQTKTAHDRLYEKIRIEAGRGRLLFVLCRCGADIRNSFVFINRVT
jgi:hypothetical protein